MEFLLFYPQIRHFRDKFSEFLWKLQGLQIKLSNIRVKTSHRFLIGFIKSSSTNWIVHKKRLHKYGFCILTAPDYCYLNQAFSIIRTMGSSGGDPSG